MFLYNCFCHLRICQSIKQNYQDKIPYLLIADLNKTSVAQLHPLFEEHRVNNRLKPKKIHIFLGIKEYPSHLNFT